ncbi:MAG: chorismate-binding protein, partial [Acidimicrobiia bacterium]|nr:chorismate-binding protein [Acidimicrobiia bacterium]
MQPSLSKEAFVELAAHHRVVPVAVEILGDRLTPVAVFSALVGDQDGFLLESVEGGERWARWSFIGWEPAFTVRSVAGESTADHGDVPIEGSDPLTVLEHLVSHYSVPPEDSLGFPGDVPPLHTGAVGFLAYDAVRYVEHLPDGPPDDRGLPEMLWQFVGGVAAFDRLRDTVLLIRNVFVGDDPAADYDDALTRLSDAVERLGTVDPVRGSGRPHFSERPDSVPNMERADFEDAVRRAVGHIMAGDAFQIVPSIRFEVDFHGDAFALYRALRLVNPSPFMFIVRSGDVAVVGSSPELMSRVRDGRVYSRPIAGTRPRGDDQPTDLALERELLADPKERAEHVMLIDLARNDLGRVCVHGSVQVDDLMVIERYSHVMHIVSGI